MPFVWWVYLWCLSPSISVTLASTCIGRITFLFWLKYPGSTAFTDYSPLIAEILHLLRVALYSATLCGTGSFIYLFSALTCLIFCHLLQFIALVPNCQIKELSWDKATYLSKFMSKVATRAHRLYREKYSITDSLGYSSEGFKPLPPLGVFE